MFDTLATEERESPNPPPRGVLPPFGTRGSGHAVTRAFYAAWSHFASAKTFAHADAYNPATAPARDIRRAMEKENRARRSEARTAFNALVRSLVAYVRRRDVRVGGGGGCGGGDGASGEGTGGGTGWEHGRDGRRGGDRRGDGGGGQSRCKPRSGWRGCPRGPASARG